MTEQLTNLWPAPLATQPLNATVTVPGSKSLSNRYLILAALGSKPGRTNDFFDQLSSGSCIKQ